MVKDTDETEQAKGKVTVLTEDDVQPMQQESKSAKSPEYVSDEQLAADAKRQRRDEEINDVSRTRQSIYDVEPQVYAPGESPEEEKVEQERRDRFYAERERNAPVFESVQPPALTEETKKEIELGKQRIEEHSRNQREARARADETDEQRNDRRQAVRQAEFTERHGEGAQASGDAAPQGVAGGDRNVADGSQTTARTRRARAS